MSTQASSSPGITLVVPLVPVSKPRMTQRDKWLDPPRPAVAAYRQFADNLRLVCTANRFTFPEAGASITFWLPMPKSWSRKKYHALYGMPHQQKPDIDNLVKAVMDALLDNDCKVWSLDRVEKRWGSIGTITFTISPLKES